MWLPTRSVESGGSDSAMRLHAPTVLAAAWRALDTPGLGPTERLKARFAFMEYALIYLVTGLAAEVAASGADWPAVWWPHLDKLERATLGEWNQVAVELARVVARKPEPALPGFAAVLVRREGRGVERTEAARALDEHLRPARNGEAHGEAAGPEYAQARLQDLAEPFRVFAAGLGRAFRHPPHVATRCRYLPSGTFDAELVPLVGVDLAPQAAELDAPLVEHRVFFLTELGIPVYAPPLLVRATFPKRTLPELRLFKRWVRGQGPHFVDPATGAVDLLPVEARGPREWIESGLDVELRQPVVGPRSKLLPGADAAEEPPEVPGFRLHERVGVGGTGRVYRGESEDGSLPGPLAIKVLDRAVAGDPRQRDRLRREFEVMRTLTSPHTVRVHRLIEDAPAGPTLVMEYVDGADLRAWCAESPRSREQAALVTAEVLQSLAEAHRRGIVHRDIKPGNVLVDRQGHARVADFGIARVLDAEPLTRTIDALGTLTWAAPEQLRASREVDHRADLYAVGRLLGFLVSGSERPEDHIAGLPGGLQAVYRKATAEDPDDRFPDAQAFLEALRLAASERFHGSPFSTGAEVDALVVEPAAIEALPGVWVHRARDHLLGDTVSVVVAENGDAAKQRLRAWLRAQGRAGPLGRIDPRRLPDGLEYCVLPLEDSRVAVAALRGELPRSRPEPPPRRRGMEPDPPRRPAPTPVVVQEEPPPPRAASEPPPWRPNLASALGAGGAALALRAVSLAVPPVGIAANALGSVSAALRTGARPVAATHGKPPYLGAWAEGTPEARPRLLARRLDDLGLVAHAQAHAQGRIVLRPESWALLQSAPLRPAWESLVDPTDRWAPAVAKHVSGLRNRRELLQALVDLERVLSSPEPPSSELARRVKVLFGVLYSIVLLGAQGVAPSRMAPWIILHDRTWCAADPTNPHRPRPLGE